MGGWVCEVPEDGRPCISLYHFPFQSTKSSWSNKRKTWLRGERGCADLLCLTQCSFHRVTGVLRWRDSLSSLHGLDLISWAFNKWTIENFCILTWRVKYADIYGMLDSFVVWCVHSEVWPFTAPVRQKCLFSSFSEAIFSWLDRSWKKALFLLPSGFLTIRSYFSWMICFAWMMLVTLLLGPGYFAVESQRQSYFASAICACCHQVAVESLDPVGDAVCFADWTMK